MHWRIEHITAVAGEAEFIAFDSKEFAHQICDHELDGSVDAYGFFVFHMVFPDCVGGKPVPLGREQADSIYSRAEGMSGSRIHTNRFSSRGLKAGEEPASFPLAQRAKILFDALFFLIKACRCIIADYEVFFVIVARARW